MILTGAALYVDLPWPPRVLHPNARVHWGQRARSAKKARADAAWAARAAGIKKSTASGLHVTAVFTPPDARVRDEADMLSNIKAALDGISDATGIDDSKFKVAIRREPPRKPGAVRLEIREISKCTD